MQNGGRHLVLTGRSGRVQRAADLALLMTSEALVVLLAGDGSAEAARSLVRSAAGAGRLGGVMHAAGLQACVVSHSAIVGSITYVQKESVW